MKRLFLILVLILSGALLSSPVAAAPRIGSHLGYTRLVFDLPGVITASGQLAAQTYTVQLGGVLKSESGPLDVPGLSRYQISGSRLTLTLSGPTLGGAGQPTVQVLPASGVQPARLVVDVPLSGAGSVLATKSLAAKNPLPKKISVPVTPLSRPARGNSPVTVVIDPGHGGVFPGMSSRWITEKDVTLDVALRVRARLQARGIKVIMTRTGDTQISTDLTQDLDARSRLANNGKVGAFISIHVNSGPDSAQGIETYYFGAPLSGSSRSTAVFENGGGSLGQELTKRASTTAQNLLGDLVAQAKLAFSRDLAIRVQQSLISVTSATNRGVKSDAFYVIKNPTTPAILTEIGFGSSPTEGPKLALPAYRDRIAGAIADAIAAYLHTP
ncbi:N-acetylmuramoyl-L-alanine amidase family protein [Deinococcus rubellus]|uniref:N-acetylmuramoyl-L-alanine amidase n=1 Tax=Deinococcus rubellus TaxID=1889240 RepID=A0ABY5YLZ0_9DEIO|nr:N-acetylmuramoyl-L-alanine amidase [Deinococcus rubellus]UWX65274.1 N-acetylmuramoyl-L-alanine amidase [Deinococcus rubellus]